MTTAIRPVIPFVSALVHETDYLNPEVQAEANLNNVLYIQCLDGSMLERKRTLSGHYFKQIQSANPKLSSKIKTDLVPDFNHLPNGKKIPKVLLDQITSFFAKVALDSREEVMAHILFNTLTGEYEVGIPLQLIYGAAVDYKFVDVKPHHTVIVDIHSHNFMGSFWSGQDNKDDEKGIWYSAVFGNMGSIPSISWRFTVEGTFYQVDPKEVFEEYEGVVIDTPFPQDWYKRITLTEETTKLVKLAYPTGIPEELSKFGLFTELEASSQEWIKTKLQDSFRGSDPMQGLSSMPKSILNHLSKTLNNNKEMFKRSSYNRGYLKEGVQNWRTGNWRFGEDENTYFPGLSLNALEKVEEVENMLSLCNGENSLKYFNLSNLTLADGVPITRLYSTGVRHILNIDSIKTDPCSKEYLLADPRDMQTVLSSISINRRVATAEQIRRMELLKRALYIHVRALKTASLIQQLYDCLPAHPSSRQVFFKVIKEHIPVSVIKKCFTYIGATLGSNLDKNLSEILFHIYNLGEEYLPSRYKKTRDTVLVPHLEKVVEVLKSGRNKEDKTDV